MMGKGLSLVVGLAVVFSFAGSVSAQPYGPERAPGFWNNMWAKTRSAFHWFAVYPVRTNDIETIGPRGASHYAPTRWGQRLSCSQPEVERSIRKVDYLLYSDFRDSIREADNPEHADGSRTERFGVPGPPPVP
jgi:hypothetical protein